MWGLQLPAGWARQVAVVSRACFSPGIMPLAVLTLLQDWREATLDLRVFLGIQGTETLPQPSLSRRQGQNKKNSPEGVRDRRLQETQPSLAPDWLAKPGIPGIRTRSLLLILRPKLESMLHFRQ